MHESALEQVKGCVSNYWATLLFKSFIVFKKEFMSFLNLKSTYQGDMYSRKGGGGEKEDIETDK